MTLDESVIYVPNIGDTVFFFRFGRPYDKLSGKVLSVNKEGNEPYVEIQPDQPIGEYAGTVRRFILKRDFLIQNNSVHDGFFKQE